ncbi:MAG: DUF6089 family protein [Flammeovirgaceae bacterium]|nr:DUF6089 family protein [Flammeovirgaceae bacterium]
MKQVKIIGCSFICIIIHFSLQAQFWEVGGSAFANNTSTDVSPAISIGNTRAGVRGYLGYHVNPYTTWRNSLSFHWLSGKDKKAPNAFLNERNISFNTKALTFTSEIEYHFMDFRKEAKKERHHFSPYLFGGLGAGIYWVSTSGETGSYGGVHIQPILPFGVGIKQKLSYFWDLAIELGNTYVFTDKLDGLFKGSPTGGNGRTGDEFDIAKFKRDNPAKRDSYYMLGVSLIYRFYRVNCPDPPIKRIK